MPETTVCCQRPAPAAREQLSAAARDALLSDGALRVPNDLALLLLDAYDRDEDPSAALASHHAWVDPDSADALTDILLDAGLPPRSRNRARLRAVGAYGRPGFGLIIDWEDPSGRPLAAPTIDGVIATFSDHMQRRLTCGQLRLLAALAHAREIHQLGGGSRAADLEATGRLLAALPHGDPGVRLDAFLAREKVTRVAAIEPRFAPVRGGWQVRPHAEGVADEPLESYYYETPGSRLGKASLDIADGAERQRIVFDERAERGLAQLRAVDRVSPVTMAHILTDPGATFGPDVDVSSLSERVIGLGPIVQRAVPILKETAGRSWWDWDSVDGGDGASEPLPPLDKDTASSLADAIAHADRDGSHYVPHPTRPDVLLQVDEALRRSVADAREAPAGADSGADSCGATEAPDPGEPQERRPTSRIGLLVRDNLEGETFNRAGRSPALVRDEAPPPPNLRAGKGLLPHQRETCDWLQAINRPAEGAWRGALLADDMGLGKTLQVLAHLDCLLRDGRSGPHLVVAPVALLTTWQEEARRWFGAAFEPILPVEGGAAALPDDAEAAATRLAAQRVVLVSYESLRRRELVFARVSWDTVVCDEAQKAKDPSTQIHRVLKTLKARFRLAVTGTPVENGLRELWAIYDFALPGLLGTLRHFNTDFIGPVAAGTYDERTDAAARLYEVIGPWYIRRMKREVLGDSLPPMTHHDHHVALSPEQQSLYDRVIREREQGASPLGLLPRLFALCAHPGMAEEGPLPSLEAALFPKAERLVALLDNIHARGEKALVFAHRKRIQRWLADTIERRYGTPTVVINGDVPSSRERFERVRRFEAEPGFGALVLAPRAAGLGLTITAANHVIHYMREWNPAVEQQATDRAYRIGQTRPVSVHTLTATSAAGRNVEEVLHDLLSEKRRLMADFVVPLGGFDLSPEQILAAAGAAPPPNVEG